MHTCFQVALHTGEAVEAGVLPEVFVPNAQMLPRSTPRCTSDEEKQAAPSGVSRYKMDRAAEAILTRFFAPSNAKLVALLGYDPGWAKPSDLDSAE